MKNFISLILCSLFFLSVFVVPASAIEREDILISSSKETLENGDYIVIEIYEHAIQPRSGKTGYNVTTYFNSGGTAIWDVVVQGTFTYNGSVSSATNATATVHLYNNNATFISKSSNYSGNTATATGTVRYNMSQVTRTARVSCDKNGNLY